MAISVLSAAPDSDAAADSPVSQRRQVLTRMPGWPQRLGVAAVSAARRRAHLAGGLLRCGRARPRVGGL